MTRITIVNMATEQRWTLAVCLVGPWVGELGTCLSVLNERYRYCSHGSRLPPVRTRGAEMMGSAEIAGSQLRKERTRL
jgi:hypothetical protein